MNIQISIMQIHNGFLVTTPPEAQAILDASRAQQQAQPKTTYCADYSEVCNALKSAWPKSSLGSN